VHARRPVAVLLRFVVLTYRALCAVHKLSSEAEAAVVSADPIVDTLADALVVFSIISAVGCFESVRQIWNCIDLHLHFLERIPSVPARIVVAFHLLVSISALLVALAINHFATYAKSWATRFGTRVLLDALARARRVYVVQ
jgi:hypothetical protein